MRRNWIKLYVDQTLRGSCFDELLPDERFVWFGFLLLAGDNALEGKICITEKMGYTNEQLAGLLRCKKELIERSIRKMIKVDKVKLYKNNVIKVINWQKYQSEYQRQKPYRSNPELQDEVTDKVTTKSDTLEREGDIEGERDKKEKKKERKYKFAEFVSITKKEYRKLINEYGRKYTKKFINKLNAFKGSKGKTYKSDYLAILNWVTEAVLKDKDKEAIQEAKIKEKEWEAKKEKEDDYKHKPIPSKIKEQIHKVLNIPDRDKLNKLKGEK